MVTFSDRGSSGSISTCQTQDTARAPSVWTNNRRDAERTQKTGGRETTEHRCAVRHGPRTAETCARAEVESPPGCSLYSE